MKFIVMFFVMVFVVMGILYILDMRKAKRIDNFLNNLSEKERNEYLDWFL